MGLSVALHEASPSWARQENPRYKRHEVNGRTFLVRHLSYTSNDSEQRNQDAETMRDLGASALGLGRVGRLMDKLNPAIAEFKLTDFNTSPSIIIYEQKNIGEQKVIIPLGFVLAFERSRDIVANYMGVDESDPRKRATIMRLLQEEILDYSTQLSIPKPITLHKVVNPGLRRTAESLVVKQHLQHHGFDLTVSGSFPGIDIHLNPRRVRTA